MTSVQIGFGLAFLAYYLFGLAMGWLLWGVQVDLYGPLPSYRGPTHVIARTRVHLRSQRGAGRHNR